MTSRRQVRHLTNDAVICPNSRTTQPLEWKSSVMALLAPAQHPRTGPHMTQVNWSESKQGARLVEVVGVVI